MNVSQAFPVDRFHFLELNFLFRSKKCSNLLMRLREPGQDPLHRLMVNGFHIRAGFLDERFDLLPLLIGQVQDRLKMREHLLRHFVRCGRSHEGASENRCEQRARHESGEKDERRVRDDSAEAHFIHSHSSH